MNDVIVISCVQCGTKLQVPRSSIGKRARCSVCQAMMPISDPQDVPMAAELVEEANQNPISETEHPFSDKQNPFSENETSPFPVRKKSPADHGGAFAAEKKGIQSGVLGGIVMMLIAVVWFVGGLAADIIFYYPPILFVIGLYALLKGLFTGNVAGGGSRT